MRWYFPIRRRRRFAVGHVFFRLRQPSKQQMKSSCKWSHVCPPIGYTHDSSILSQFPVFFGLGPTIGPIIHVSPKTWLDLWDRYAGRRILCLFPGMKATQTRRVYSSWDSDPTQKLKAKCLFQTRRRGLFVTAPYAWPCNECSVAFGFFASEAFGCASRLSNWSRGTKKISFNFYIKMWNSNKFINLYMLLLVLQNFIFILGRKTKNKTISVWLIKWRWKLIVYKV